MVIEEYRCNIYHKHVEMETMWTRLADSVQFLVCVILNSHVLFLTLFDLYSTTVS